MGRSFTTAIFNELWDVNMTKGGGIKGALQRGAGGARRQTVAATCE